jgi:hypothetical protein
VASQLSEETASLFTNTAPESNVSPEGEKIAVEIPELDPLTEEESLEQPAEVAPEIIQTPLLPIIEMNMINSVVPFVAGPEAMSTMFTISMESQFKEMIESIVVATVETESVEPAVSDSEADLTKADVGGWWVK